jgi:hypothetical protein
MKTLITAALMLLSATAFAGPNDTTWNPPARFDHPYHGKLTIYSLPQAEVARRCKMLVGIDAAAYQLRGCSLYLGTPGTLCVIVMIDEPYGNQTPTAVLRHEIGHCNGWPADHPD